MTQKERTIHLVGAQETNYPWGVECRIIRALEDLGHHVISTDFRKNREKLNDILLQPADLVLVCRGEWIPPEIIGKIPYATALWYAELLGTISETDQDAETRRKQLAHNCHAFDYVFTHDAPSIEVCKKLGANNVFWLTTAAVDPTINTAINIPKTYDISFVGSQTGRRKRFIEAIKDSFEIYTPQLWDLNELNRLYNQSKIVLNIHLSDLLNTEVRLCEVLGAGAFMLTEELSMKDFLVDGEHLVAFKRNSSEDCVEKIKYYLSCDTEREKIANRGFQFVHEKHTYRHRMKTLLESIDFGVKKKIWPSFGLGFTFDTNGKPTQQLNKFYSAVENSLRVETHHSSSNNYNGREDRKHLSQGKLRIFAAFAHVNWEDNNLQPALEEFGEVIRFRFNFDDQYQPDWHASGKATMNHKMLQEILTLHRKKPIDVFFGYLSGRTVFPGTLRAIQRMGIPTLNISLDDKAKFVGYLEPSGHSGMIDIANAFNLCWTSTEDAIEKYHSVGANAIYLPEGANPKVYKPTDIPFDMDVSFVGQCYGQRPKMIKYLSDKGINVNAFGRGWPVGELPVEEMVRIYSHSRINLGFSTVGDSKEISCLKGRDFEVPMSGGLYFTQHHMELENVYNIGKEIVCYHNIDDLAEKIIYYLEHPDQAAVIREAGYKRAIKDHTWVNRFRVAFNQMGLFKEEYNHPKKCLQNISTPEIGHSEIGKILEQGKSFYKTGNIQKAKYCFEKVFSLEPDNVEAYNNLGVISFQEDELDGAIKLFSKVLKINDNYVEAIENLGKCYEAKGDYFEALKWFKRVLSISETSVEILNCLGNCFVQLGDLSNAKKVYSESWRLDNTQENLEALLKRLDTANISGRYSNVVHDLVLKNNSESLNTIYSSQKKQDQENAFDILKKDFSKTYYDLKNNNIEKFATPFWNHFNAKIEKAILPTPPYSFLRNPTIAWTMVATGGNWLTHELAFLEERIDKERLTVLLKEDYVGDPVIINSPYFTSANSIHHLYHLIRFSEETECNLAGQGTVIEWGGGYGNLAKIFRRLNNDDHTYIIIDTPLFSCVQWLYLSTILGEENVKLLKKSEDNFYKGKINILPVCFIEVIDLNADLFVATWSLSESSRYSQDYVTSKGFFNAEHLLLAYQDSNKDLPDADRIGNLAANFGAFIKDINFLPGNNYAFK